MILTRHILDILKRTHPHGLFETTLKAELNVALPEQPGTQELKDGLSHLKRLGWISDAKDALTNDTIWTVTETGNEK